MFCCEICETSSYWTIHQKNHISLKIKAKAYYISLTTLERLFWGLETGKKLFKENFSVSLEIYSKILLVSFDIFKIDGGLFLSYQNSFFANLK